MLIFFNYDLKYLFFSLWNILRFVDTVMTLKLYENKEKLLLHGLAVFFFCILILCSFFIHTVLYLSWLNTPVKINYVTNKVSHFINDIMTEVPYG